MTGFRDHLISTFGAGILALTPVQGFAQTQTPEATIGRSMPSDIDPESGFRLPLPKREDLDETGKRIYDRAMTPGASIAGLQGPAGIQLYSKGGEQLSALNRYLRFQSGISPRTREIAILITAREMDSQFEWVAHEGEALKEGVPPAVIDVIKHRKSTEGLEGMDAIVIELGRQILARPQGDLGDVRQGQGLVRAEQADRPGHAHGQLRRHRRAAHHGRHAAARREETAAADSVSVKTPPAAARAPGSCP